MEMEAEVTAKKWGNSFGIVIPKEIVRAENIKENEKLVVDIKKRQLGREFIGLLSDWQGDPQKLKDEARRGWG
jgi:bifunctional DNA-binding transcriptional regulator/antitoxin component of YhaV-PrlF toxin-antitoxin module